MIYVVLRPENLLPVKAYLDHQAAWEHATHLRGEVAPVELEPGLTDEDLEKLIDALHEGDHYTGLYTNHPELVEKLRAIQRATAGRSGR